MEARVEANRRNLPVTEFRTKMRENNCVYPGWHIDPLSFEPFGRFRIYYRVIGQELHAERLLESRRLAASDDR